MPREPAVPWRVLLPPSRAPLPPPFAGARRLDFFWGRNAIYHGLRALGLAPGDAVLVPAYHCGTLVEPILRFGAEVRFYAIRTNCAPDWVDLEARLSDRVRAVLAIHYFGFPAPILRLREWCDARGLRLIEDCAHVLLGEADGAPLGSFGDVSVFSWRKYLPMCDGGQLLLNDPAADVEVPWDRPTLRMRARALQSFGQRMLASSGNRAIRSLAAAARMPAWFKRAVHGPVGASAAAAQADPGSVEFDPTALNLGMSAPSRWVVRRSDFPAIARRRRENYRLLHDEIRGLPGVVPLYGAAPEDGCPWVFPLLTPDRPGFHVALRAGGVPAFAWDGVVHPSLPQEGFQEAWFLYRHLTLLPLHQSLRPAELRAMAQAVRRAAARS